MAQTEDERAPLGMIASPVAFFGVTFLLSAPFYALNCLAQLSIVGGPQMGPVYISLFTFAPISAAAILTLRNSGASGVKTLLRRIFDFKKIQRSRWYVAILALPIALSTLSLAVTHLIGRSVPPPLAPLAALPAVLPFVFVLAAAEEAGWMGYAYETMEVRSGAFPAAMNLGVIWALWHVPFFVFLMPNPMHFAAQILTLVATRVLIVWVFNNTGKSVFAAILYHALDNTAMVILPGAHSSDPACAIAYCGVTVTAAAVVTSRCGTQTLSPFP